MQLSPRKLPSFAARITTNRKTLARRNATKTVEQWREISRYSVVKDNRTRLITRRKCPRFHRRVTVTNDSRCDRLDRTLRRFLFCNTIEQEFSISARETENEVSSDQENAITTRLNEIRDNDVKKRIGVERARAPTRTHADDVALTSRTKMARQIEIPGWETTPSHC